MDATEQILLFVLSFVANFFSALAGGGAGLIQFPVLLFLGLTFATALATHKIASVALGVGATIKHLRANSVTWPFTLFIISAGIPGVALGGVVILDIPERPAEIALGLLTLGLGLYSVFSPNLGQDIQLKHRNMTGYIVGAMGLFFIGFLNGSLASGTGLFATMLQVRWFGLDYKLAVAYTLVAVGLFWNGAGAVVLGVLGQVQWDWLPCLLLGSLIGGYLGAHVGLQKGNQWIKRVYECVTLIVACSLLFKS